MTGMLNAVSFVLLVASCAGVCACGPVQPPGAEQICGSRLAGDLVVSEFMADPQDADAGKQYIELYNTTADEIALEGLSLFQSLLDGSRENAVVLSGATIPGRSYFVLGDVAPNALSKPSYLNYGYATGLGALRHADGRIGIRCGKQLIDAVSYSNADSGRARELDGTLPPDSARSASNENWCSESQPLDELPPAGQNFGTPGAPNSVCARVVPAGMCVDPELGQARGIEPPSPGDLVISEVMAAPAAVSEADGEWFELYARSDLDLNGLSVRSGSSRVVLSGDNCLRISSGSEVILARSSDPSLNAGLPPPRATVTTLLPDGASFLSISNGDSVIDEVHWASAKKGVAWQLSANAVDAAPEERAKAFCAASRVYGQGDKGTPGAPNDTCTPAASADAGSDASSDAGSDAGSLMDPDAGIAQGTCLDSISGLLRDPVSPKRGDLLITEVLPAPSVGNGGPGEWFEVLANANADLNGLVLSNESTASVTLTSQACLSVKAGDWLVFARSADAAKNGGLPPVTATFSFALADAKSALQAERAVVLGLPGSELDRVTWTKSTRGTSLQRSLSELGAPANNTNTWCLSPISATFGAGDHGTPATPNVDCP